MTIRPKPRMKKLDAASWMCWTQAEGGRRIVGWGKTPDAAFFAWSEA